MKIYLFTGVLLLMGNFLCGNAHKITIFNNTSTEISVLYKSMNGNIQKEYNVTVKPKEASLVPAPSTYESVVIRNSNDRDESLSIPKKDIGKYIFITEINNGLLVRTLHKFNASKL